MHHILLMLMALGWWDGAAGGDPSPDPPASGGYRLRRFSRSNT